MNKIFRVAMKNRSTMDILKPRYDEFRKGNSAWKNVAEIQLEYYKQHGDIDKVAPTTMIFDEIDKSLDIETVWKLYTEILPKIVETNGNQIILVSHNPLILSDQIYNNPLYNIISVDKDYTGQMKKLLKDVRF